MTQTMTMDKPMRPKTGNAWEIPLAVATMLLLALVTHGCGWLLGDAYGPWYRWLDLTQLIALAPLAVLLTATIASRRTEGEPWVLPVATTVWGTALFLSVMTAGISGIVLFFRWLLPTLEMREDGVVIAGCILAIVMSLAALLGGALLGFQDELGEMNQKLPWREKLRRVIEDAQERAGCMLHGVNLMVLVLTVAIGPLLTLGVIGVLWLTFLTGAAITAIRQMSR